LTGSLGNLEQALASDRFRFEHMDVTEAIPADGGVDAVLHLASPASPVQYLRHPIETMKAGAFGTHLALELAREEHAVFLLSSTSEVYGDPMVHPQPETYWGNVNPVGPRAVYDEAKRFSEALSMAYQRHHDVQVRIARIFNTYGPRLRPEDGRAVPSFIHQALAGADITVHGDGLQTRSLCYVDDLIEGLWLLLHSDHVGPMNIGSPHEVTVLELAETVRSIAGSSSRIVFAERPEDDPDLRRPDLTLARAVIGWEPTVSLEKGLATTIDWARSTWMK
jgi:nucleoside-diphosphate-sugar epimerase